MSIWVLSDRCNIWYAAAGMDNRINNTVFTVFKLQTHLETNYLLPFQCNACFFSEWLCEKEKEKKKTLDGQQPIGDLIKQRGPNNSSN